MSSIESVCEALARIAPLRLAESWDNVGLLVGDRQGSVSNIMTCLTLTPNVVEEAIERQTDLIISHHPLPFKPLAKITTDTIPGSMLLKLIGAGVAIYSAHTAFDSAAGGINQMWADRLGLLNTEPLILRDDVQEETVVDGPGRQGRLPNPESLGDLVTRAAEAVQAPSARRVGNPEQQISKVALACGSGGSFLGAAKRRGCDAMITGEATFHTCLEAESLGIGLILLGHYYSERFAMEQLALRLREDFPDVTVWASVKEYDPLTPN